jgi:hypothetical protein
MGRNGKEIAMTHIILEQCGTVQWLPRHAYDVERPSELRPVLLLDAVQFVMEQLPPGVRDSAWIDTGSGSISFGEIQVLYADTRMCRRSPGVPIDATEDALIRTKALAIWDNEGGAPGPAIGSKAENARTRRP